MPARAPRPDRDTRTSPYRGLGGIASMLVALGSLSACGPPTATEHVVDLPSSFNRPVATLGPDEPVAGTYGSAPRWPTSADQMRRVIDATGRVVLQLDFDPGGTILRAEAAPVIEQIAILLRNDPALRLSIDGYAGAGGNDARSHELSRQLADTVRAALIANGVGADRLRARGHGAGGTASRRVELVKLD